MDWLPRLFNENEVIFVDDQEAELEIVRLCYKRSRLKNPLVTLQSPLELLDYLSQVESGAKPLPAMLLMDVNMPEMSGFDALESVSKQDFLDNDWPVVMLNSSDTEADRDKSKALGASGFRTKPLSANEYVDFFKSLRPI